MGETMIAPPLPEDQPSDSFFSRALGVFIAPGRTFESIARRPDFMAPPIIGIVGSVAIIEAMLWKIGADRIIRQSLEVSGKASQMTPEQLDQTVQKVAGFTAISMHVGGLIGVPIFLVVIAAVGLFIANVIFGASVDFKTSFSVVCWANLVLQIGVILALVIILMGDPEQFNSENPIPSTVGFFLNPRETSKALYVLASSFDIFRVWFIFLSALGISAATAKKVGTMAIFLTFLGVWVLITLGKVGLAAITG
jgi:hypothetical protein